MCGCFCDFFFLFSRQNQVPQIIIGMDGVIHHNKAFCRDSNDI